MTYIGIVSVLSNPKPGEKVPPLVVKTPPVVKTAGELHTIRTIARRVLTRIVRKREQT